MPSIYGACDIEVPAPICSACDDAELGGIRGVAFIHVDAYEQIIANPSNAAIWDMLRSQGLIFIIPKTRGTFNGGEVITRPGFGDKSTVNVGFNFSLEYDDPSYKENCAFYNQMMQSSLYHVAFLTETQVKISAKTVDTVPTTPLTDDITEQAVWHAIITWIDKLQPCAFDAPQGIFECIDYDTLPPTLILTFTHHGAIAGNEATPFTGQLVDTATNWVESLVYNGKPNSDNTGYETVSNKGGDIAFMISGPFDARPAILPKAKDLTVYNTIHYYGAQTTVTSSALQTRGVCGIFGDDVAVADSSQVCACPQAAAGFHDYMAQKFGVPLFEPGKIYYFAMYVKGDGMQGAYSANLLEVKIPTAEAPVDPEVPCSGLAFDAQWVSENVPWPNP